MGKGLIIISVVYGSLVLGTLIKFFSKGVRGYRLLLCAFAPLCLFIAPLPIAVITYLDSDLEFEGRFPFLSRALFALSFACFMFRAFPAFVGLTGVHLAQKSEKINVKKNKHLGKGSSKSSRSDLVASELFKVLLKDLYNSGNGREESAARLA